MGRRMVGSHELDGNSNFENGRITPNLPTQNGHTVHHAGDFEVPHPFVFSYTPTRWERIRFYLMLVFVFPIRLILVLVCLLSAGLIAKIAVAFHPIDAKYRMTLWRRWLKGPVIVLVRALFFVCGIHYVNVIGKRVTSKEAPILCMAPHSSFIDVLIGFVCGLPVTVSTKQNAETPIVGTLFRLTEAIFIDRSDPNSREDSMNEIVRRARTMGEWPQIMTFPEGCCTNRKSLLTFKRGAFAAGVPVQPLLLRYKNQLDNATWVNVGPNQVTLFMVLMCTPQTDIEIEFLDVYHPTQQEIDDPELYAENVRSTISKRLKTPMGHYTFKDLRQLLETYGKPNRFPIYFLKTLWTKGKVVMPEAFSTSHKSAASS